MKLTSASIYLVRAIFLIAFASTPVAQAGISVGAKYNLKVRRSNLCFDVARGSKDQGASVMAWGCKGASDSSRLNQQFQFKAAASYYEIMAVHSGMCVGVPNFDGGESAPLIQVKCSDTSEKLFKVQASKNGAYLVLVSVKSGLCVSALSLGTQAGVRSSNPSATTASTRISSRKRPSDPRYQRNSLNSPVDLSLVTLSQRKARPFIAT